MIAQAERPEVDGAGGEFTTHGLRQALRRGQFAFPGGYRKHLLCSDGGTLCFDCAREEFAQITWAIRSQSGCGWRVVGEYVNWEGPPTVCDHCNKEFASEYGEVDA